MMINRVNARSFVFRVLLSIGRTAFVSLSGFLSIRWLLGCWTIRGTGRRRKSDLMPGRAEHLPTHHERTVLQKLRTGIELQQDGLNRQVKNGQSKG
jgi:hypothetical protein